VAGDLQFADAVIEIEDRTGFIKAVVLGEVGRQRRPDTLEVAAGVFPGFLLAILPEIFPLRRGACFQIDESGLSGNGSDASFGSGTSNATIVAEIKP
jgi:hypothetical protein